MIVGISGKIGSGKDTVGKIIQYLISTNRDKPAKGGWTFDNYINTSDWQIKKFAGKLKQIVSILTGISVEDLEKQEVKDRVLGEEWNYWIAEGNYDSPRFSNVDEAVELIKKYNYGFCQEKDITVRQLLQEVGTDAMRDVIHSNVWVNALFADYRNSLIKPNNLSSVTDKDFEFYSNHCFNSIFKQDNRPYSIQEFLKNKVPDLTDKMYNDWEKAINNSYPNWIITDLRFFNELKAVKDRNGITIRVNRPCTNCGVYNNIACNTCSHSNLHESETALDNAEFDYVINNNGTIEDLIKEIKSILIAEGII